MASCPEVDPVGCAAMSIPDHRHIVGITFARARLLAAVGVGHGLAAEAELPYDARILTARYETLDGAPYQPPYGDLHHRDETLRGVGDPILALRWDRRLAAHWQLGLRGGVSLPVGETTENPDPLAAQSLPHEHMQIGSGTFDPRASVLGAWTPGRLGIYGRLDAVWPLYRSDRGYRGGPQLDLVLGPGYHLRPRLFGFVQLAASHTGQKRWDGMANESSGRDAVRLALGGHVALGDAWRLGAVVQLELASRAVGGTFEQPFTGTLTLTFGSPIPTGRGSL